MLFGREYDSQIPPEEEKNQSVTAFAVGNTSLLLSQQGLTPATALITRTKFKTRIKNLDDICHLSNYQDVGMTQTKTMVVLKYAPQDPIKK